MDLVDHAEAVGLLGRDRVALITLNRPHADNAITTAMGAALTDAVEEIAVRTAVRVVVLTGAGDRAFSVGSDLRQRKSMTKEDWLRQRQAFDRTLYTVRQLRKPIFAAVNGIAWDLMRAARRIADKIASNSPTAVQSVKRAVHPGGGQPIEQAIAIMMDAHWRSAVHPDRVEGIGAFNDGREPSFVDSDF